MLVKLVNLSIILKVLLSSLRSSSKNFFMMILFYFIFDLEVV